MDTKIVGTDKHDRVVIGSGVQYVDMGDGNDRIVIYGDVGEPDPAQTGGAEGRVTEAIAEGSANDTITGGAGADRFEWRALLDAKEEVIAEHTNLAGHTNWAKVAGENDNVHDHLVEGFGLDTLTDFNKAEGDCIVVEGHTVTLASIEYGSDSGGSYSLLTFISQQGYGGAGGANTATGAHDEDPLGQIKVYGDKVFESDVTVVNNTDGIDRLYAADDIYSDIDGSATQEAYSNTDGTNYDGSLYQQTDRVTIGEGRQDVDTGGGNDIIYSFSDGGEPDPAQTNGADGRVNPAVPDGLGDDIIKGGQGKDTFAFRLLLNAKEEILEKHTRDDGSVNWRKVAGENDAVHDHWVEGIGNDVLLDFSNQDGDKLTLRGHTVEIANIEYGEDDGGDFSLISIRSQQGAGGGAHDEDDLGTLKVYGDKVTQDDIEVKKKVFDGVDAFDGIDGLPNHIAGTKEDDTLAGTGAADNIHGGRGEDDIRAGGGDDFVFGGGNSDMLFGEGGNDWLEGSWGRNTLDGGAGEDTLASTAGFDTMTGGADADTFLFSGNTRGATITDWEAGIDMIDLSRLDNVDGLGDVGIEQVDATTSLVTFDNNKGKEVEVTVLSSTTFELSATDFFV